MINRDGYLPRVFCLALLITCHFTNSVSNNVSTKCHRRGYHALLFNPTAWSKPMCDVWQRHDVVNKVNGETIEFKPDMRLPRIDPVEVGFTRTVHHENQIYTLKTLSLRPPIFEIQDFLNSDECDEIVAMAKSDGLENSKTVWSESDEIVADGDLHEIFERLDVDGDQSLDYFELLDGVTAIKDVQVELEDLKELFRNLELNLFDDDKITFAEFEILTSPEIYQQIKSHLGEVEKKKSRVKSRQSFSTFLDPSVNERRQEFFEKLHQRISKVTQLPIEMIKSSESLQVIKYEVGGHYHAHHDSEDSEYAPCCHLLGDSDQLCRPCRYATMFYYLNEPIEGGETAFPFADNVTYDSSKLAREEHYRLNLSRYCNKANLVYMPRKGAALFWYNHVIDDDTGWLGKLDELSSHGGCDVIQGVKWAANNWINAVNDREADLAIWGYFKDSRAQ